MRATVGIVVLLAAMMAAGCAGSKGLHEAGSGDIPEWFTNTPQDPNYLFSAQSQTSRDMQMSIDAAVQSARAEIARQTEVKVSAIQKRFQEEVGVGAESELMQQFTQATKTVVSTSLSGSRVRHQKIAKEGATWRSYVLVEYPLGAANQALLQQLKANRDMYTRFRATEAFQELEGEAAEYEQFKQQQGQ